MRISDWSSDVCSSDLTESRFANYDRTVGRTLDHNPILGLGVKPREQDNHIAVGSHSTFVSAFTKSGTLGLSLVVAYRSEERRGGKECVSPGRYRWSPYH